ncbi:MAG: DUF1871 family protein [Peptostreptococcaceae bacterium]|nr:DUF1871 family protein [Peptostreptococcaceae bacterium]
MQNHIKNIINKWDPIDLLDCCPDDEYSGEISKIEKIIQGGETDIDNLAKNIWDIFTENFSSDVFEKDLNECKIIAKNLLNIK